jgi:hypothetical protein
MQAAQDGEFAEWVASRARKGACITRDDVYDSGTAMLTEAAKAQATRGYVRDIGRPSTLSNTFFMRYLPLGISHTRWYYIVPGVPRCTFRKIFLVH